MLAIERDRRVRPGRPRRHQGTHAAGWLAHQPEAVAADVVHVRIDGRDGRRHRDHGFERVATLGQDRAPGRNCHVMRRADRAAAMAGAVQVHQAGCSARLSKPRLRSSASGLGSRPRKAV